MQAKKITKKILFSLAALSFLALGALPVGAQVTQTNSCTLVKDVEVSIVVAGVDNDVIKIYTGSLVSDQVDSTQATAPEKNQMNGSRGANGNIAVRIKEGTTDKDYGADSIIPGNPVNRDIPAASLAAIANEWGIICLMSTINTITNWISLVVLILSTGLLIYAGFLWMTGGDNPENKEKAGKVILAALVGFGIVILARVLPAVISGILL